MLLSNIYRILLPLKDFTWFPGVSEEAEVRLRTELQSDHAAELEDLRDYYEKKLKDMENRLKRELEMLQSEQESEVR